MSIAYPIFPEEIRTSYKQFWDSNEYDNRKLYEVLGKHPSFKNCTGAENNLTAAFKRDIERRTKGTIPLSLVIQIYGTQGDGKSKLAIELAKYIDPTFSHKKLFMKIEPLLNALKHAKKNDCFILDEQAILFGEGALRQLAELQNVEEITRIRQIHFIYCSPTLREHLASHYTLKVIQKNIDKRITKFAFTNYNGSYFYGWGQARIPKDQDCEVYKNYEPVKLKYVDDVLQRSTQKYDIFKKADKLILHPDIKYCKTKTDFLVLIQDLFPTLTMGEHNKIYSAALIARRRANASRGVGGAGDRGK